MNLRPHHLLCTLGYVGKGYDENFVRQMSLITDRLCNEEDIRINIVFSTDDICAHCPRMLGTDCCKDNLQIKQLDQKVVEHFGLEERRYLYKELIAQLNVKLSAGLVHDICAHCGWYHIGVCKNRVAEYAEQLRERKTALLFKRAFRNDNTDKFWAALHPPRLTWPGIIAYGEGEAPEN